MLLTTPYPSGDGVIFPHLFPCIVATKFDSSITKLKDTDLSVLDSTNLSNGGTAGRNLYAIPNTDYFTLSQSTGNVWIVNFNDLADRYANMITTSYFNAHPIDNTRALVLSDVDGLKVRFASFDLNNPRECLTFSDWYSFECGSCNPGKLLNEGDCVLSCPPEKKVQVSTNSCVDKVCPLDCLECAPFTETCT